ncbi:MAG: CehA/McbA family metallohydrolase, partial [Clostridiales bacterium]|nr:CehA/McbA family metallohydrolase [Clostridiales bacterium]
HDITVSCTHPADFHVTLGWLPRCRDGQEIVCRAREAVPPASVVTIRFGAAGQWTLAPIAAAYPLRVYESVEGDGLYRIIPEAHALVCRAGSPEQVQATLRPAEGPEEYVLGIGLRDRYGNPAPAGHQALVTLPTGQKAELRLSGAEPTTATRLRLAGDAPTTCRVVVSGLGLDTATNPAPRLAGADGQVYFGEIHSHTALSDGARSVDDLYQFARDGQQLDFAAVSDHDSHLYGFGMFPGDWAIVREAAERYYAPRRFVTLLGYEWTPVEPARATGHHNVYYRDTDGPLFSSSDSRASTVPDLLAALRELGRPALVIPHHPVACKNAAGRPEATLTVAWDTYDPTLMRLVEIYSKWGCSERVPPEYRPLKFSAPGHAVQDALARGYRLGFTGGSDSHVAMPGGRFDEGTRGNLRYEGSGLVGVWAPALTREDIFDALYARRCYATSGARILVDFRVAGRPMGAELAWADPNAPRAIAGQVVGTAEIARVEIVRDGSVWQTLAGDGSSVCRFEREDASPLAGPAYYYLRVIQRDDERAWSSPVWIDPPAA